MSEGPLDQTYFSIFQDTPTLLHSLSIKGDGRRQVKLGFLLRGVVGLLLGAQGFADPNGRGNSCHN